MSRPWTLRRRLIVVVGLVIVVVSVFIAVTVSVATRRTLIERVDDDLLVFAARATDRPEPPIVTEEGEPEPPIVSEEGEGLFQPVAVVQLDREGAVLSARPAGYADDPDPLPDVSALTLRDLEADTFLTMDTIGGDGSARVLIRETSQGYALMATSLDSVDSTARQTLWASLAVSVGAAVVGITATWLLVRRGFRPVDAMIETARAISDGDLSKRTDLVESNTELGRLSTALDHMLARIERSDRERLREAERLRRFADDASHELRTPISAIAGYAELYNAGGVEPGPGLDRAMARITEASDRAGRLVEDLLALARLDREIGVNRSPLDLSALVADIVEDARVGTERDITCDTAGSVVITGDGVWLRQAIDNLINNAVAHAPDSMSIELRVGTVGNQARLLVIDHGPGIAEVDRERVFDRFARPDSGRDRSHGGVGLGLAIVREVVLSHEGEVTILETPGGGTTVEMLLPLASGSGAAP